MSATPPKTLPQLASRLGLKLMRPELFQQAMTHSSFINENNGAEVRDNQRLEFLGDAILDFVVGEWLFMRYPDAHEGELTSLRAFLVRTETLARFAMEIDLGDFMWLGRGEDASGGRQRVANLCAAYEALIGAMYLDQGIATTRDWVFSLLNSQAHDIDDRFSAKDAKSRLQEHTQAQLHVTPSYRIIEAVGPDHAKIFTAQVLVGGLSWGIGKGTSKQLAEQAAAQAALSEHAPDR